MLSAVERVGVQGQSGQGHRDVDKQQAGQLVLLINGCVICKFFKENIQR